jgi:TPR repeat protein
MDIEQEAMQAWIEGNLPKAESLLLQAAKSGSGSAAHNLGSLYASGGPGVKKDKEKSRKYFEQALASGFEETVSSDPVWFRKT